MLLRGSAFQKSLEVCYCLWGAIQTRAWVRPETQNGGKNSLCLIQSPYRTPRTSQEHHQNEKRSFCPKTFQKPPRNKNRAPKKKLRKGELSHAVFGQQKWGISGPEKPPRKTPDSQSKKPRNTRPDIKRIFSRHFRERKTKQSSKNIGKTAQKNTRPTPTPKNKSSLPKIFSNSGPDIEKIFRDIFGSEKPNNRTRT